MRIEDPNLEIVEAARMAYQSAVLSNGSSEMGISAAAEAVSNVSRLPVCVSRSIAVIALQKLDLI